MAPDACREGACCGAALLWQCAAIGWACTKVGGLFETELLTDGYGVVHGALKAVTAYPAALPAPLRRRVLLPAGPQRRGQVHHYQCIDGGAALFSWCVWAPPAWLG